MKDEKKDDCFVLSTSHDQQPPTLVDGSELADADSLLFSFKLHANDKDDDIDDDDDNDDPDCEQEDELEQQQVLPDQQPLPEQPHQEDSDDAHDLPQHQNIEQAEAFADQVFQAVLGAQLIQTAYLGHKLGWFAALAGRNNSNSRDNNVSSNNNAKHKHNNNDNHNNNHHHYRSNNNIIALTPVELAQQTHSSARYAQEWLEQQTVAGWILCHNPAQSNPTLRKYSLPPAHAAVLTDPDALCYRLPLVVLRAGAGKQLDQLRHAYQHDTGVGRWISEEDYPAKLNNQKKTRNNNNNAVVLDTNNEPNDDDDDQRDAQAAQNRPFYLHALPHILEDHVLTPEQVAKLKHGRGRVADLGAGYAWSSIGVAHHFPACEVDAYDLDAPSICRANEIIQEQGLHDRVRAHCRDAAQALDQDDFMPCDLVMACECVHDLGDPISVLRTMKHLSGTAGTVLIMDARTADSFQQGIGDPYEQALYGVSCLRCLADGKSHGPQSAATGAVMRPQVLRAYAQQAGFRDMERVPVQHPFFAFYKLLK